MKYCILGGGGSFGLHTANYILERGVDIERVISIGRGTVKPPCFSLGIGDGDDRYVYRPYHITHEHDLLLDYLDKERPDVIINFAAQGEGATSFYHSWRYYETNCVGLCRLVETLQARDYLRRFVHIGTSELYGSTSEPASENAPVRPTSPYAISKAAFDQHLIAIAKRGFPMNIVRPCNAYGEGQQLHRIIPKAVLYGLLGKKFPLHGGGVAEKSYIHSWDLARAIYLVSRHGGVGEVYNAGAVAPTPIRSIVEMIAEKTGLEFEVTDDREHQDAKYWLDSSKIARDVHWYPVINWDDGLGRVIAWVRKYLPELRQMPTDFIMRA